MPSGNFETEWSRPFKWLLKVGSWKLTEIKLAEKKRKMNRRMKRHEAGAEKRERNLREHCCWLMVKNAANGLIRF